MDKERFGTLFAEVLERAITAAQNEFLRPIVGRVEIDLQYRGVHRVSPSEVVEQLYLGSDRFYRYIDVGVVSAREDKVVFFVRPSGHPPGAWNDTHDPQDLGPFKVLTPWRLG